MNGIGLVVHSPLHRARDTCYGMLDLDGHEPESLEALKELTPWESFLRGRRQLNKRILEFEEWILDQETDSIVVVGHSEYFLYMLGLSKENKFRNCDVWQATFDGQWNHLKLRYRLDATMSW